MGRPNEKSTNSGGNDTQNWGALLRRLHPVKTAEAVAAEIGAPVRSVENWMAGTAAPSLRWFLALVAAYGPEVLVHAFPAAPRWLSAAARAEEAQRLAAEIDRLHARRAALTGGGA